jgi:hypothetical protein
MASLILTLSLLAQAPAEGADDASSSTEGQRRTIEYLRDVYRADADRYEFYRDAQRRQALKLAEKPVMRWATDDDWSGDVFVWTHDGRPEVIGCMLSGPGGAKNRLMFHEFHLLAEKAIAANDLQTRRRWEPKEGLTPSLITDAPAPARTSGARLTQMRQLSREFTAHMEAAGPWQLRLLPQPLYRYGDEKGDVADGALFAYVWPKGTDPEVVLLLECRKTGTGLAWHFAPVRFSSRSVWLRRHDKEVWRVESHREPAGGTTAFIYTTAFVRNIPREPPEETESGERDGKPKK